MRINIVKPAPGRNIRRGEHIPNQARRVFQIVEVKTDALQGLPERRGD